MDPQTAQMLEAMYQLPPGTINTPIGGNEYPAIVSPPNNSNPIRYTAGQMEPLKPYRGGQEMIKGTDVQPNYQPKALATLKPSPTSPQGGNVDALINSMYGGSGPYGGQPMPGPVRPAATNMGQGPTVAAAAGKAPGNPLNTPPPLATQFAHAPAPKTPGVDPAILEAGLSQSNPQNIPFPLAHYLYGGQ